MAKSSKSQNPEFLEKRRRAIVELAKRRRQAPPLTSGAVPPLDASRKVAKVIGPVAYAVRPQPQN
jgi:hypothetical protein